MSGIIAGLLTVARKLNNYALDATGGGLWIDTTHYKVVVPAGKRWYVLGGVTKRDVSGTVIVYAYDSSDNEILLYQSEAAATTLVMYPEALYFIGTPLILDPGEYVMASFGAVQDTAAFCTCIVLEIDV